MRNNIKIKLKKIFYNKKSIVILSLLFIFVIILILFNFRKKIDEFRITKHNLYQYLNGIKIEYTGEIKIEKNNRVSNLIIKDEIIELDSNPIYFTDEKKSLFPKNMSVIFPVKGIQQKINYYSTIYSNLGDIYVNDRSLNLKLNNCIIYDGNDIFYIIDKSKIIFDNNFIELSPMSCLICDDRNKVMFIYDYDNDKIMEFRDFKDDVIIATDNYKINASLDLMNYNKKSRLFIKNIEILKNLEKN